MKFKEICNIFQKIESTSSRNVMSNILSGVYKVLSKGESQVVSYMLLGRVSPMFIPAEFNISEKNLLKLLKEIYSDNDVEKLRRETGDIGSVMVSLVNREGGVLSILDVYEGLWRIINDSGNGSARRKLNTISILLKDMSGIEAKYFLRIIVGNLRLGISIKSIIDSISLYISRTKEYSERLERAYGYCTDIGYLIGGILDNSEEVDNFINNISIVPGVPILPKLVQKVSSFKEGVDRMGTDFYVQPKYDGLRCQIHKYSLRDKSSSVGIWNRYYINKDQGNNLSIFQMTTEDIVVKLYTRNLEDITEMFPEIVESARKLNCNNCVLDSEIVGWDDKNIKFMSYQDTMTRRRKYYVDSIKEDVPVDAFIFDILYLNSNDISKRSMSERVGILKELDIDKTESLQLSPIDIVSDEKGLRDCFNRYIKENLEGVIIKKVDTIYTPGVRDYDWIKIKKSIDSKLVDTLDLVVLGYYYGSGKRAEYGVGAILCGIYNKTEDRFESFTKVGTGITDNQLKEIFERLSSISVDEKPKNVICEDFLIPDVWVYPEVVVTVSADEISKNRSSNDIARGYSLRFPRLIEWNRVDKSIYDVFTVEEL